MGTVYETQSAVNGIVHLGRVIPAGTYYASWKVLDYGAGGTVDFTIGGSAVSTTPLNSGDFNGQWTVPVAINVPVVSSNVLVTFRRSVPLQSRQIFLLRGLYLTTKQGEVVFGDDSIVTPLLPTQVDPSPARKGNILQNGGFEVGTGHGWGLQEGGARSFAFASLWDNTISYEGSGSIKLPDQNVLVSRPYRVRGNRQFTLSAWAKAAVGGTITLTVQNGDVYLPTNYPPAVFLARTFAVTTNWQRFFVSGVLWDYPASDYYVRLRVLDSVGRNVWIDGVQLEEGDLTAYAPAQSLETGLICTQPSNLFYEDEPILMQLLVRNTGDTLTAATVPYEIYDYLNRRVAAGSTNIVVPAQSRWAGDLNVATGLRGIFRIVLSVQGKEHSREEVVYGVVPRPQQMGIDTNSLIGIHANFTDFQSAAFQKLGIKWNRTSSPSRAFRWATIQPINSTFYWAPDDLAAATSHGVSVLGTLGLEWPAWAATNGLPDLAKWEAFVEGVVGHYKDQVKYWEIGNEPQWSFTADFYTQLLKRAIAGAHRADPGAQVVGLGGSFTLSFSTNVLAQLSSNDRASLNSVSTHIYPKSPASDYANFRQNIRDVYGLSIMNTESGIWDRGFYTTENSDFIQTDYAWPQKAADRFDYGHRGAAELLAYSFLNNVGNGLSQYFYYDARIAVGPAYASTHPTIFDYDDSIRAKGVTYSVLAKLFDHSSGLGNISPSASSIIYLFDRAGTPLLGMWSPDRTNRTLTMNLGTASYRVYDLMGNPLSNSDGKVRYGAAPVFVEGAGISVATLRTAAQGGTIAVVPDATPPNLSLLVHPTGPTLESPVKLRWLAIDETASTSYGIPKETSRETEGDPKAIQYSFYMQGLETTWSPWTPVTFVDYYQMPPGTYDFQVRARDAFGNISTTNHATIIVLATPSLLPLRLISSGPIGSFQIQVSGGTNQGSIVIETSQDLIHWSPFRTNAATGAPFAVPDPANGSMPPRFYRAKEQP